MKKLKYYKKIQNNSIIISLYKILNNNNIINIININNKKYNILNKWNYIINIINIQYYYVEIIDFIHDHIHNYAKKIFELHYKYPYYNFQKLGQYIHYIGEKLIYNIISKKLSAINFNVSL